LLSALLFFTIAVMTGNAQRFLLAVIVMEIPLQLDSYLFYREKAAALGALGGLNISVTTVCLMILYAWWLSRSLLGVTPPPWASILKDLPFIVYLATVALSVVVARDVMLTGFEIFLVFQAFLLYLYIARNVRTRGDVRFLITWLLIGLALQSLIMFALRITGSSVEIASVFARIDDGVRVGGTIGSPNGAASYLTLLLAPAFSLLFSRLEGRYKWLAAGAFCLGGGALLLTLSRGGWLAFAVSLMLCYLLLSRRGLLSLRLHFTLLLTVLVLVLLFHNQVASRLVEPDNGSAYSRIPLMRLTWRIIGDHPLLGVGANNFAVVLRQYVTPDFSREWLYTVHNAYLLIWSETGIISLLAFLWMLAVVLRRAWRVWMRRDLLLSPLAAGFMAALVGQMVHMMVDLFNGRPQVQMLWMIAALISAMSALEGGDEPESRSARSRGLLAQNRSYGSVVGFPGDSTIRGDS